MTLLGWTMYRCNHCLRSNLPKWLSYLLVNSLGLPQHRHVELLRTENQHQDLLNRGISHVATEDSLDEKADI
jgi:hypothetical protein